MTSNNKLITPELSELREGVKSAKMLLNALLDGKKITNHEVSKYATNTNKPLIAPKLRGSDNALIEGKKITNHEVSKYATNSVKDILGDLKRDYGLNLLDEWVKDPQTGTRYKKYFINKSGIAHARLLLKYLTTKDKALLSKLNIKAKAKEPKNA